MTKHLMCGCEYDQDSKQFVHVCEACQATIEKQKANEAAHRKMTVEQRLTALENHVWRR